MSRGKFLSFVVLGLCLALGASADELVIGTGTLTNTYPINSYLYGRFSQALYPASELVGPMTITNIAYYFSADTDGGSATISVRMGNIAATALTTTPVPAGSLTLVKNSYVQPTTGPVGWVDILLDTPFFYDGTNSLLIQVCQSTSTYDSGNTYWNYTTQAVSTLFGYSSSTSCPPATQTLSTSRPNIRITYTAGGSTWTLTMLAPSGLGSGTVSPAVGTSTHLDGSYANIVATPSFASVFDYWEVDGAFYSSNATDTLLMDEDYDVQAFFDLAPAVPLPVCNNFDGTWSGTPPAPAGWLVINSDADAYTWRQGNNYIVPTHSEPYAAVGMGCNNDWMISPAIDIPVGVNAEIVWWDRVESASYPNVYDVLISTTGFGIGDFTVLANYNCINVPWTEHVLSLGAYAGNTVYIAFHQTFSQATYYGFGIDDVCIQEAPIYWNLTMDAPVGNGTVSPAAGVYPYAQGTIVDVVASPDCGYVFSNWIGNVADPNAASTTITMDADYTIQAVFTASGTVFLSEGFETGATGWTYYDADGDTYLWNVLCTTTTPHTGTCNATSASYQGVALTPDNWMVSPQVNLTYASDAVMAWYVAAQDQAWPSEYYDVLVSTGGNAIVDFTNVVHSETVLAAGPDGNNYWLRSVDLTPFVGGNIYVAFRHYNSTDWFRINIDDVCITGTEVIPTATPTTEPPTATPTAEPPTATPTGPTPTPTVAIIPTTGPAGIGLLLLAIGALMSFAGIRRK